MVKSNLLVAIILKLPSPLRLLGFVFAHKGHREIRQTICLQDPRVAGLTTYDIGYVAGDDMMGNMLATCWNKNVGNNVGLWIETCFSSA